MLENPAVMIDLTDAPPERVSGWLIELVHERTGEPVGVFMGLQRGRPSWESDADRAVRFARECDARAVGHYILTRHRWVATEHSWS